MSALRVRKELVRAAWRTWGWRGLTRRLAYELASRAGRVRAAEDRWLASHLGEPRPLLPVGLTPPPPMGEGGAEHGEVVAEVERDALSLYGGGVVVPLGEPIRWHRHPLTGHDHDSTAHWSAISDASPDQGDIKDIWDRSRLGWLTSDLHRWGAMGDDAVAEGIWKVIEDWHRANPPYRGPNWMCGQETSLRAINIMILADALRPSPASTAARQVLVASMVRDAVGRVSPTLGYALSQRNNHAISEAGFLWTASVLSPDLSDGAEIRSAAARALTEAIADQFAVDGSYAQHSPTYQRLALHVLLWVLAVARSTGVEAPTGVVDAVRRSVGFLASLVAPGSGGQVPNLGGNDGALLFDLTGLPIADFRPVIAHAAAASGLLSPFERGEWDAEAGWFGLEPTAERRRRGPSVDSPANVNVHPLARGDVHAVLRGGPIRHRPAHADQLHVDVWIDGSPVAVDAGSYRYTAPEPWGNALAGEAVHNVPRRPGHPQAVLAGRFFWRSWHTATVQWSRSDDNLAVRLLTLTLDDQTELFRVVAVTADLAMVVDRASAPVTVRWNLASGASVEVAPGRTEAVGSGWRASFAHDGTADLPERSADDPASGWHAPRYGELLPVEVLELPVQGGSAAAVFGRPDGPFDLAALADRLGGLVLGAQPDRVIDALRTAIEVSSTEDR